MFEPVVFAQNLRTARKRQGLSQKELAEKLYLSAQAVSKWERGESVPEVAYICHMAELLHVSVQWLLGVDAAAERALIAVDGGGTKTEFALISTDGRLLQHLVLPGCNPNSCSVSGTMDILRQGIDALLREHCHVQAIFIGGAGMGSGNNGTAVERMLRSMYPHLPVACRSDIFNIIAQAEDPDNAIAVICGTGCVVYSTTNGKLRRFGGGGWHVETLGSGYDIGRSALLAALEHRDGTGPETVLTDKVERQLAGNVWDKISFVHSQSPDFFASFAPLVTETWQKGDAVATKIIEDNLNRLAHLIITALGYTPDVRQVLAGGSLLAKNEAFKKALQQRLPEKLRLDVVARPPIWGACLQSAKLAKLPAPDPELFIKGYQQGE